MVIDKNGLWPGRRKFKSMAEACQDIDEFMGCVDDGPFDNKIIEDGD